LIEPVAVAVHFQNMDVVGKPVEQRTGAGQIRTPKAFSLKTLRFISDVGSENSNHWIRDRWRIRT
jgi:hypothetical protein